MIVTVTLNPSLDEWVYLPRLRVGALNRAKRFVRYAGGKGINVSRALHELGEPTLAIALAGGGDGKMLSALLRRQGIAHRFLEVAGSTRNNYEIQTQTPRVVTQINSPGPAVSSSVLRTVAARLRRAQPRPRCAVFSGSLPPGLPADSYYRLLRGLELKGVPTVLDASGPALRQGLGARPWLIKPNRHEAEELLGVRLRRIKEIARAAQQMVRRGPSLALISLGAEGAVLASSRSTGTLWAHPPRVRIDSPVGAGDSLVAGFVTSWLRRRSLTEALRLGVACGAASAMTPGTELCRRRDVRALAPRVAIRAL